MYTEPQFQRNFVLFMVLTSLFLIGILYLANVVWLWRFYYISDVMDLPSDFNFEYFMDQQFVLMNIVFAAATVIVIPILCFVAIILSHKIAGPLYRLRNHIMYNSKVAKEGDLRFIHFRKKDNFKTLAMAYNEQVKLIKKLRREIEDIKGEEAKVEIKKVS